MAVGMLTLRLTLAVGMVVTVGCGAMNRLFEGDQVARGQLLFISHGCNGCHTVGVAGTPIGPDLSGIGQRHSRAWFEAWLRDPAKQQPMAHMPRLALPRGDLRPLAAYLASLR